MRHGLRLLTLAFGCFSPLALVLSCSTSSGRILLADGSYELTCEGSLSKCLLQMEEVCKDTGYEVLRATEKRERVGPNELATEIVKSTGLVRCRKTNALFSTEPSAPEPPPAATEAPPPLPAHAPLPALSAAPESSAAPPAPSATPVPPPLPPAPSASPASP